MQIKPFIGVSSMSKEEKEIISSNYIDAVTRSGGIPVILSNLVTNKEDIATLAFKLDGLLVTGGEDVDPALYGEEPHPKLGNVSPKRDAFELALIKEVMKQDKPLLAICRGCQMLNVAMGGDVYQDIYAQNQETTLIQHAQRSPMSHGSHDVQVEKQTLLYQLVGKETFKVNSNHHQAIRRTAPSFITSATASDGIVEAIESTEHEFVLGVQWHPEAMVNDDTPSQQIYRAFVTHCEKAMKRPVATG